MRTWRVIVGLALVEAAGACGKLAAGDYQPPPLLSIPVELDLHGAEPGGEVRVLLVWQPAEWTTEPADALLQPNPLAGDLAVSCPRPDPSCGWSGSATCRVKQGLADHVATLRAPQGPVALEVPIYALPPPAALRDLGGGRAALGYLLFLPGPGAGAGPVEPLANSAFNGPPGAPGDAYRTSYLLAYREGDPASPACGATCGDPESPPPASSPGVLSLLPAGFSLVLKHEKAVAGAGLVPDFLAQLPGESRISVQGHGEDAAGAWCGELTVRQTWGGLASTSFGGRCASTPGTLVCRLREAPCEVRVRWHELCETGQPPACAPGPSVADSPVGTPAHVVFHRLPSGAVLGFGTSEPAGPAPASVYDPVRREWWPTGAPAFPRAAAAVAGLRSGRVLVTGGSAGDDASRSAELFDPAAGAWLSALSMRAARSGHTATVLPSGGVLVIGGHSEASPGGRWDAEIYDPAEGTWLPFDLGTQGPPLMHHTALLLPGEPSPILVTGADGGPESFLCVPAASAPAADCRATAAMSSAHPGGTFTLLPSGQVLALGGRADPTSAELFDPLAGTWAPVARMPRGRANHAAVVLPGSGLVVVAGGEAEDGAARVEVDVYDPGLDRWGAADPLQYPRASFAMFASAGDEVLVVGGPTPFLIYPPPAERLCVSPPAAPVTPGRAGSAR